VAIDDHELRESVVNQTNTCVTITGPRAVTVEPGPIPRPGADQVLIRTAYTGISAGTELNVYRGTAPQWRSHQDPATGLFVPEAPEWAYPLVYGYANVGAVEQLGANVTELSRGDLVFSFQPHCEWVVADAAGVVVLPELPDLRRAVFLANLNTAYNGVLDTRPALGDVVVVSGLGVVGLLVTRLLARAGAGLIIGVDPIESRRRLALEAGAALTYSPEEPVAEAVRELTGGRGADHVIEVSGVPKALAEAIRIAGFGATVVAMSWYGSTLDGVGFGGEFHHNRVNIRSSQVGAVDPALGPLWSNDRRMALACELLTELPLERYITHELQPHDAALAYGMIDSRDESVLQCVFRFGGAS
jgi:2-desacetyl-2-hydroxyethyl bacteriochlorophyllide A dehydrogenase